jgi:hypothetical protein
MLQVMPHTWQQCVQLHQHQQLLGWQLSGML